MPENVTPAVKPSPLAELFGRLIGAAILLTLGFAVGLVAAWALLALAHVLFTV